MAKDLTYTNGVIAAREKYLLKDKISRLCEGGAEEALRALTESGFGKGVEVASVYGYEKLVVADERDIDGFIREYAPSDTELQYFLAPRDFHNAKALLKAHFLGLDKQSLLAPDGLVSADFIAERIALGKYDGLDKFLAEALAEGAALFSEDGSPDLSGAETGAIFDKALFKRLSESCRKDKTLKILVRTKADMTNILTALRSASAEYASKFYLSGGKLDEKQLSKLFSENADEAEHALDGTEYTEFLKLCLADRAAGLPFTRAERLQESYEANYLAANKYELEKNRPFLYYVFRRRAENADVRILFACLLAGMKETDIKKRLRSTGDKWKAVN
ncbi:MAG TPA: hypothetical protein DD415_05200 [Clostridiales bacterium]|nr:hypothetical protein [Clostridiales bacterium]